MAWHRPTWSTSSGRRLRPVAPSPPIPNSGTSSKRGSPLRSAARSIRAAYPFTPDLAMLTYIARRIGIGLLMLIALSVLVFVLLRLAPGDAIDAYINPAAPLSMDELAALRARLGLDQPLPVQYFGWLLAAISGDFGFSTQQIG